MRHPGVPRRLRGTYAGLAHPAAIDHLRSLGVTAVELMPVHAFVDSARLHQLGLRNYWGYDTIGYFAPEGRYSSAGDRGAQVVEFKQMVRALHDAGPRGLPRRRLQPHRGGATTWARRSPSGASTTRPTTTWPPMTGVTTGT